MKQLGRYTILYELGHGAMGTVYRGHDPQIDREVALKTINVEGLGGGEEADFRQRFFREARAAGRLTHSGIVTVHDVGEDETTKTPFLVMEFVAGMTLEDLGGGGPLPVEKSLDLARQIAEALDYAHRRGIVHRDIKPANIIVTGDGHAKITDFGIAKLATAKFTQTGTVMGTPAYMAPEQLTAKPVDARSDLFSLGTILYWLLTGQRAFSGDSLAALSYSVVHTDPTPPSQLVSGLPADFDYVVERALAKDPAQRYQTGRELADDLDDLKHSRLPRSKAPGVAAPAALAVASHPAVVAIPAPVAKPVARATVLEPPPEKKRRWLWPVAIAVLLLLLGVGAWWALRESPPAAPVSETVAAPTSAPRTSPSTSESRPRVASLASVRLVGEHSFEQGTLRISADGKLLEELSLSDATGRIAASFRVPTDTRTITIRIRATSASASAGGWVPPGQRKKRRTAQTVTFDQTESISARFQPGEARTLEIRVEDGLQLRWLD